MHMSQILVAHTIRRKAKAAGGDMAEDAQKRSSRACDVSRAYFRYTHTHTRDMIDADNQSCKV